MFLLQYLMVVAGVLEMDLITLSKWLQVVPAVLYTFHTILQQFAVELNLAIYYYYCYKIVWASTIDVNWQ